MSERSESLSGLSRLEGRRRANRMMGFIQKCSKLICLKWRGTPFQPEWKLGRWKPCASHRSVPPARSATMSQVLPSNRVCLCVKLSHRVDPYKRKNLFFLIIGLDPDTTASTRFPSSVSWDFCSSSSRKRSRSVSELSGRRTGVACCP